MEQQLTLKYRPKNLPDIVGQRSIVDILSSMLNKHFSEGAPLPAGIMFCGSRGTGKTTSARILARLLNCNDRQGLMSCGKCHSCLQIDAGNDVCVIELDAASNGLVEDIRRLKDVALTSHSGNFRVFILDEVHGLSNTAFQALLKILEEPPPQTLFILATTEPHKVLDTIISRVMVFEFKRLSENDLVDRLAFIAYSEGITVEPDALQAIASYVDGGMRDAVMALDQLRYVSDVITLQSFIDYYGIVGSNTYYDLVQHLLNGSIVQGIEVLDISYGRSSDVTQLVDGFAAFLRDLLLVKYGAAEKFEDLAVRLTEQQLLSMIGVVWDVRSKVRHTGMNNRTVLDLMYVQMARSMGKASVVSVVASSTQKATRDSVASLFAT